MTRTTRPIEACRGHAAPLQKAAITTLTFVLVLWLTPSLQGKEGSEPQWQPLWDGESFEGWHEIGEGDWQIQDDMIVGRHKAETPEYGHLVTDQTYQDFTVRLKFKALEGNSGLYFRVEKGGFSGISGFQAEIDAAQDVGGLYETNGRGWVVQPSQEELEKAFRPKEWNEMVVSAHGREIVVHVNGHQTAKLEDDPGRQQGHIALQLHGNQDVHVKFREIEIQTPRSR